MLAKLPSVPVAVMWFRRDLRVDDHPALAAAAATGAMLPLFVVDPAFDRAGVPRRVVLARALRALDVPLVHRHGDPVEIVPRVAAEIGADAVFVSADANPYGRRRDDAVAAALGRDGRALHRVGSPYFAEPGAVTKADGSGYAVFTPYLRAWRPTRPVPQPAVDTDVDWITAPSDPAPSEPATDLDLPPVAEREATDRWDAFVATRLDEYAAHRDLPALDGTSRLSAALRWGSVHPRQLLADLGDHSFARAVPDRARVA